jgi:hypothetical protein
MSGSGRAASFKPKLELAVDDSYTSPHVIIPTGSIVTVSLLEIASLAAIVEHRRASDAELGAELTKATTAP